jgi:hypothetical protein
MMFTIPASDPDAATMVRMAQHVCARCGMPLLASDLTVRWNLAPHTCGGEFEWLSERG